MDDMPKPNPDSSRLAARGTQGSKETPPHDEIVDVSGPVQPRHIGLGPLPPALDKELEEKFGHLEEASKETPYILDQPDLPLDEAVGYILGHIPQDKYGPPPSGTMWTLPDKPWE